MFDFNEVNAKNAEIVDHLVKSVSLVTKGLEGMTTEATEFSKKTMEHGVVHFENLMSAKNLEAAVELHSTYVKSSYDLAIEQVTKMTDLFVDMTKGTTASAPVEHVKAAKVATPKAAAAKVSRSAASVKSGVAA